MKISIITAVFNNRDTVGDAINSVLTQSYANTELVVIDGGSTDGTLDVLSGHAARIAILVTEPDHGIYDALNKGVGLATGDVIGFLHSDDLMADETVLQRIAYAFADPDVDAIYGDLVYVKRSDPSKIVRYWRAGSFKLSKLRWGWMPPHPTFYCRRRIYESYGGFDIAFRIAADYDCMLRFLTQSLRVRYLPYLLVRMRLGGASNRSLRNMLLKSGEDIDSLRRHGMSAWIGLIGKNLRKLPQFFVRQ